MSVSVVIPTYNGEQTIAETILSVVRQTWRDLTVIVSDDGSTDGTIDIVESFDDQRVRVLRDRSRVGAESNWNRALAAADREFVKVLAQDDLVYPTGIERQVQALHDEPKASFAAVTRDIIGADGTTLLTRRGLSGLEGVIDLVLGSRRVVRTGANQFGEGAAVLIRADACLATGGFDASLPYVTDIDYWMRLLNWGPAIAIPETLAAFRVTAGSWSNSIQRSQGKQFAQFVDRLAEDHRRGITLSDLRIGKTKARLNGALRHGFYLRHRVHL